MKGDAFGAILLVSLIHREAVEGPVQFVKTTLYLEDSWVQDIFSLFEVPLGNFDWLRAFRLDTCSSPFFRLPCL